MPERALRPSMTLFATYERLMSTFKKQNARKGIKTQPSQERKLIALMVCLKNKMPERALRLNHRKNGN